MNQKKVNMSEGFISQDESTKVSLRNWPEDVRYRYGYGIDEWNTLISNRIGVDFNGMRRISEFNGKAFFQNKRTTSIYKRHRSKNEESR